eukprot:5390874-Prorocentrum_lima.AAC.1
MTSSLVGSEMCIRDSFNGGEGWLRLKTVGGAFECEAELVLSTGGGALPCLLYTSDAADDM